MTATEMTRIDRTIEIQAPPERVWRALTNPKELSTWFQVKVEGEIAEGNEIWMEALHKGHQGVRFRVLFIVLTPPTRLAWQWHPGAVDPAVDYSAEPRTTVTFTLEPSGKGTRLTLAETGFNAVSLARRAKVFADNTRGWAEVLVWLSNYAEASA